MVGRTQTIIIERRGMTIAEYKKMIGYQIPRINDDICIEESTYSVRKIAHSFDNDQIILTVI